MTFNSRNQTSVHQIANHVYSSQANCFTNQASDYFNIILLLFLFFIVIITVINVNVNFMNEGLVTTMC